MRKRGFRGVFSLLLALMMVCSVLPTAAFAEGNVEPADQAAEQLVEQPAPEQPTSQVTEQPADQPEGGEAQQPTEKKDAPQGEQPATPPQTYTVVYADGAENTVFEAKSFPNLTSGAPTPAFGDDPIRDGYTFLGWEPALAETVTGDVTYTAKWEASVQAATQSAENSSQEIATYRKPHVDATEDMNVDTSGRYSFNVYIIYHTNYPDGNNKTYTVQYEVGRTNDVSKGLMIPVNKLKTYSALGFTKSGYEPLFSESTWYARSDCTVLRGNFRAYKNDEIHLYAGWKQTVEPDPSTVVLHPAVGSTVTGVKVSAGDKINGYSIIGIEGHDITVSLGKHNVNNDTFKLPYAKDIWEGVDNNKVDYISWAGSGSSSRSEGDSALLANGKNTAYYYFKGVPVMPTFTLEYNANNGTGAPATETYTAKSQDERSHDFTISSQKPTRDGYTFLGWSTSSSATTADYQSGGSINVTGTATLYAVWERAKPSDSVVKSLLETQVIIHCVNKDAGHKDHGYPLRYELTDVTRVKDGYTCQVWVYAKNGNESYIDKYNVTYPNTNHILDISDNGIRMFNLKYNDGGDGWYISDHEYSLPVTFNVKCETVTPPTSVPDAPEEDTIKSLLNKKILVICKLVPAHDGQLLEWLDDSYALPAEGVVRNDDGRYTYTITILADKYVANYYVKNPTHTLVGPKSVDVTLTWNEGTKQWEAPEGEKVPGGVKIAEFEVTCKTVTPPVDNKPDAPSHDDLSKLIGNIAVNCTNNAATHDPKSKGYALIENSYTTNGVEGSAESGYTYTVTISPEKYVEQFGTDTKVTHTTEDGTATVVLEYKDNAWTVKSGTPVSFNAVCETVTPPVDDKPAGPSDEDLTKIEVDVLCNVKGDTHKATYKLPEGTYDVGKVYGSKTDGYACDVTIYAEEYVKEFCKTKYGPHLLDGNDKETLTLEYVEGKWDVAGKYVTFYVKCVVPKPTKADLAGIKVFVKCTNSGATHGDKEKEYGLIDGYYYVGEPSFDGKAGVYRCTVNVNGDSYVEQYGKDVGNVNHDWSPVDTIYKYAYLIATWTDDGYVWSVDKDDKDGSTVTFEAWCDQQTIPVPTFDDLADMLDVEIKCTADDTHKSKEPTYALKDNTFRIGTVDQSGNAPTCIVTVISKEYVDAFNKETGKTHTPESAERKVHLVWTGEYWDLKDSDFDGTVVFEVACKDTPAQTFTVTYKDGVAGKAFQDQSYTVPSGSATPAFNGTPYLAGYVFTGWTPAVVPTVTANATYIATWKLDTNNNGKPDDEEERYTVTYTDGAGGKAFADQVYTGLLSGTSTPKFNGTPVRAGYYFIGWSPKLSATVTGSVTYTATWTTAYGGLDNVPKTGDNGLTLALSALLLFSFCGAAACVISTKKRG